MPDFSNRIIVNNKALNFEFSKVRTPAGNKYFVNAFDQRNLVASFELKQKNHTWEIILPAPEWILDIQKNLLRAIHEYHLH
jgi:hypothetical protein